MDVMMGSSLAMVVCVGHFEVAIGEKNVLKTISLVFRQNEHMSELDLRDEGHGRCHIQSGALEKREKERGKRMRTRDASLATAAINHHFRRFSTAALLQEADNPILLTYLEGLPRPDPKHDETIHAIPRALSGKNIAAKERNLGRVPSIVFEAEDGQHGGNKRLISVQSNQIKKLVDHLGRSFFLSRLFDLEVRPEFGSDDIIEKLHLHAGTDAVLNVTFIRAPSDAWLKVDVPLLYRGDDVSPGLKKGSSLNIIKRTVQYLCPADVIPPYIDVDLSELDVGEKIIAGNLNVHPALKLLISKDEVVVKIMGSRVSDQKKSKGLWPTKIFPFQDFEEFVFSIVGFMGEAISQLSAKEVMPAYAHDVDG
ncbi:50S ribosomal protein L25 [Striga asiatica]|uniref:50S ribosomal protein L25 n=1 Tax=Striga asiatica TaxID=4170 RepID=A0A5A7RK43_STRAF|nr:50S ribosomal protein L25 [Striga asiatica]